MTAPASPPVRRLGAHFQLKALLGKSSACMLWAVLDERDQQERLLLMPRAKPADFALWQQAVQRAVRLQHAALAPVRELGLVDGHAFIAYERRLGRTLDEHLSRHRVPAPLEAASWALHWAEGLATVHEAGWCLGELQPFQALIGDDGRAHLLGLGLDAHGPATDAPGRQRQREGAAAEVLSLGLLLNRLVGGRAPLEQTDTQDVLRRLPPHGSDFVRLGFDAAHPVPEALRAIVNRSTATQPSQRYPNARALAKALSAWVGHQQHPEGGAVGQLLDRVQRFGALPVTRPEAVRGVQGAGLEQQHSGALAALVLQDIALAFELLRRVNQARAREGRNEGQVLNLQRAVAMLGIGELGAAAAALRPWPGVLAPERVLNLRLAVARAQRAAELAQALAPAGYESEVVRLVSYAQGLGRLLLQYHLPDEADQIAQLMLPPPGEGAVQAVGMGERLAAFAVLGCDLDSLTQALLRHWGLGEELQRLTQRPDPEAAIHPPQGDLDALRLSVALAQELADALAQSEPHRRRAIEACTRRYARALGLTPRDIQVALFPEQAQAALKGRA